MVEFEENVPQSYSHTLKRCFKRMVRIKVQCGFANFIPSPMQRLNSLLTSSDGRSIVVMIDQINNSYGGNNEIHFLFFFAYPCRTSII